MGHHEHAGALTEPVRAETTVEQRVETESRFVIRVSAADATHSSESSHLLRRSATLSAVRVAPSGGRVVCRAGWVAAHPALAITPHKRRVSSGGNPIGGAAAGASVGVGAVRRSGREYAREI